MKVYENNNNKMQGKAPLRNDQNSQNNQAKALRRYNKHKGKKKEHQ